MKLASNCPFRTIPEKPLPIIRQWISECSQNHKECKHRAQSAHTQSWYPRRLLYNEGTLPRLTACVQECREEQPLGAYATLTHRWTGSTRPRLTTATIQDMKASVDFCSMSKTFQDALQVAVALVIRYLWIDCLCIVQDSKEDWATEANSIQDVYENGFLNISATLRESSEGGLFSNHPYDSRPLRVEIESQDRNAEAWPCEIVHSEYWQNTVTGTPVNQRAWVLQERLLSH